MNEIIDTHLHFWNPQRLDYFWLTPKEGMLNRIFLPPELEPTRIQTGVTEAIFVQASHDPRENAFAFELANTHPWITGIIGWVDLLSSRLELDLEAPCQDKRFKGVRHLSHNETDTRWILRPELRRGLAALEDQRLIFELVLRPEQTNHAPELVGLFPNLTFVLDHLGNPPMQETEFAIWQETMHKLGQHPNVIAKISGLQQLEPKQLEQVLETTLSTFRHSHLMFGSDYPVSLTKYPYQKIITRISTALESLGVTREHALWAKNARRIYRL